MTFMCSLLPVLNHFHNIANFPKAGVYASGLSGRHAMCAADLHEVMVHGMEGEGVDLVLKLLAESLRETRIALVVLANNAVVALNV